MKKVALVTCYFQKNYGSMLQAFATQKILDYLGYENETICIDGIKSDIKKAKLKHYFSCIQDPHILKGKIGYLNRLIRIKVNKDFRKKIEIRNNKFLEFQNSMFRLTKKLNGRQEMANYCKTCSSVLVGSDQLWLPSNIDADYYTLTFVPRNINKVAYATSFGVSSIKKRQYKVAHSFLERINHISVREVTGQQLVKKIINQYVPVVCDPTLLFNEKQWEELLPENRLIHEKYILCYLLGSNSAQREMIRYIKKITELKIVILPHMDEFVKADCSFSDYPLYDIGPNEFINLVRNAEYIFTDSYHGTIFSIIHQKRFFTFKRFKEDNTSLSTNSRIYSLLKKLDLQDRLISSDANIESYLLKNIDYINVFKKLDEFRKESLDFLNNALKDGE